MKLLTLSAFLALSASLVAASPLDLDLDKRAVVWSPPITYPHAGTVWKVGNRHNVTWSTANPPSGAKSQTGFLVLAKTGRFILANDLAKGFKLSAGHVEIQVPNVPTDDDYAIVLEGDPGNFGPRFTIQH